MAKSSMKVACVLPDIHFPFQDKNALKVALDLINYVKPSVIIQVGDLVDCYSISRFSKDPDRISGTSLQKEFDTFF